MFVLALAHGGFSIAHFHALGNLDPLVSMLASNPSTRQLESVSVPAPGRGGPGDPLPDGGHQPRLLARQPVGAGVESPCT